jgi:hypothetical protein
MRLVFVTVLAAAVSLALPGIARAQGEDPDRTVAGGGIHVEGWSGAIDARAAQKGLTINDSKMEQQGGNLHFAIGPAAVYWNPATTASGDFTAKATFHETKVNPEHPHPAGVFIGGSGLGGDQQRLMYCTAYGTGEFLVRLFNGANVVTLVKRMPHDAVHKAGADGGVTNEVGWTVKGGRAECVINGTVVAGFDKAEIVADDKLASTDGIVGLRFSHNMDVAVSNFGVGK